VAAARTRARMIESWRVLPPSVGRLAHRRHWRADIPVSNALEQAAFALRNGAPAVMALHSRREEAAVDDRRSPDRHLPLRRFPDNETAATTMGRGRGRRDAMVVSWGSLVRAQYLPPENPLETAGFLVGRRGVWAAAEAPCESRARVPRTVFRFGYVRSERSDRSRVAVGTAS